MSSLTFSAIPATGSCGPLLPFNAISDQWCSVGVSCWAFCCAECKLLKKPPGRAMSFPGHFGSSLRNLKQLLWITPARGVCLWKNFSQTQLVGLYFEWCMTEGVNNTSNRPPGQNWKVYVHFWNDVDLDGLYSSFYCTDYLQCVVFLS